MKRPTVLDQYVGEWVALSDGNVVEHAPTSAELAAKLVALGPEGDDVLMQFVAPPSTTWMVGVG